MVYTPQPESKMKIKKMVNRLRSRLPVSTNTLRENSSRQGTALAVPERGAHAAASAAEANSLITGTIFKMVCLLSAAIIAALPSLAQQPPAPSLPELQWRMIGPFRGGRVVPVTGVLGNPNEYLFGAVGGGVWKTTNGGNTWEPIFDAEPIASIGAIAVAPSDPQIIYVGTGESDMRSDISYGDGVYKSTDGGVTWRNIGLRDSQNIGRILVDPHDPNTVLVAALGHAFGPNPERGVYRSTDGGATWKKVLSKNDDTGAIDLCWDAANPTVV
jgi:photosystem II stability/assembly factor-like uncharacterized protein